MYSPAEISKAYRLKTSIILLIPSLTVVMLLLYHPPKIIVALTGTLNGVKLQEISDSLQDSQLQLHRKNEILQNLQLQLQNCKTQESAISVVAGDGLKFQLQKPQFQSWADWSAANQGKSFSDFRMAEISYYKSQIDSIWVLIKKGGSDE